MVMTYLGNIYYQAKKQTMFQTITVRAPSHHNILGAVKGPELPLLGQVCMVLMLMLIRISQIGLEKGPEPPLLGQVSFLP